MTYVSNLWSSDFYLNHDKKYATNFGLIKLEEINFIQKSFERNELVNFQDVRQKYAQQKLAKEETFLIIEGLAWLCTIQSVSRVHRDVRRLDQ